LLHPALSAGEKLSESGASDVRELCNTLLSAYLIQLLDTGLLHADPHPGNLIRTNDGKICVLDFGLMTEVTPEQRIALVEYIAHLTIQVSLLGGADEKGSGFSTSVHIGCSSVPFLIFVLHALWLSDLCAAVFPRYGSFLPLQDWENVARDLQTLGFIPADAGDPVAMGMAEPLGKILVQLSGGGGATKLNIDAGEATARWLLWEVWQMCRRRCLASWQRSACLVS
jgi:hypothetical protein